MRKRSFQQGVVDKERVLFAYSLFRGKYFH